MPIDLLKRFYEDKELRQTVKASMLQYCQDSAGRDVMEGKDARGYVEAKKVLENFYTQLRNKYGDNGKKGQETPE